MPLITLPDGSTRQFDQPVTVHDVAELRIITGRDDQALEILRHSTAHLLAQA